MKLESPTRLIAIVGGSGAGKTWLADRLRQRFGPEVTRLSLDDFYYDLSHLPSERRDRVNFDRPLAIDWPTVEAVLSDCRLGHRTFVPRYNFATHTRRPRSEPWTPGVLVVMDGLWLLWRPAVRNLFDLRVFLDCPAQLRFERRLARDVAERGRTPDSVREQFWKTVAPMHDRYVAPQAKWADIILSVPPGEAELRRLGARIEALIVSAMAAERELESVAMSHASSAGNGPGSRPGEQSWLHGPLEEDWRSSGHSPHALFGTKKHQ